MFQSCFLLLGNEEDDQLYYTQIYLDEKFRQDHEIVLDSTSQIFQNLNGATTDVELVFEDSYPKLLNTLYDTEPLVLHGNGPSKRVLNTLANYIPKAWNYEDHCTACWDDTLNFEDLPEIPILILAIFVEKPTPFIEEFFEKISKLDYPKDKISLLIHNSQDFHVEDVEEFLKREEDKYLSVKHLEQSTKEWHARNEGIALCEKIKCDYYFSVDSEAHIDNAQTLKLLIEQNR